MKLEFILAVPMVLMVLIGFFAWRSEFAKQKTIAEKRKINSVKVDLD